MRFMIGMVLSMGLLLAATAAFADDVTGVDKMLCTTVQVTSCLDTGDCIVDLPWNLNVPQFMEVDLKGKRLSTTKASGENRATTIDTLRHEDGVIVIQGFELGRAFSIVITESSGSMSLAVAREGRAVGIFGACTPMPVAH